MHSPIRGATPKMEDVADGLDVSVEPTTAANAKRNPPAAAAVNRFMQDSARRSCSFVNLSSDARHELTKMARQNSFVLTSCQEPNVGMVTRLTRPKENRTACEKADGFQPGYAKHGWLCKCASCAPRGGLVVPMSPTTPDSPSSVMEPSSTVAPEKTPPSSPIVKGREYDVYNMCPLMGPPPLLASRRPRPFLHLLSNQRASQLAVLRDGKTPAVGPDVQRGELRHVGHAHRRRQGGGRVGRTARTPAGRHQRSLPPPEFSAFQQPCTSW